MDDDVPTSQHRVDALAEQNSQQRQQLERAYAEMRHLHAQQPGKR
jgi:hypothetical protein